MKQEVRITLTLEVDITITKKEIKQYISEMEMAYTQQASARNRWEFSKISNIKVEEESEIYQTEN